MRARLAPLLALGAVLGAGLTGGCAQPGSPPGGEVDRSPPRVLEVIPAAFDTLTERDATVVIRFNERVSERLRGVSDWEEAVLVSPATSPLSVRAGRRDLRISLIGGWEPDRVYRVTVLPVFQDLFGNPREEPITLVFSTGAPFSDAALAGFVTDRLTALPIADARVEAIRRIDQTLFVASTDTAGFFAMPYLPAGAYDVRAWQDQNRDRMVDFFEIRDSLDLAFGVQDTAVVELALLPADTTPARLARAEPIDSMKVRLLFDDYFAVGPVDGEAWLYSLPDSSAVGEGQLVHASRLDSILAAEAEALALRQEVLAVMDSLATVEVAPDTSRPADEPPRARPDAPPLPSQELVLLTPVRLEPDSAYYVIVRGVTNIRGIPDGGGTASFRMPSAPPDTVPADTLPDALLSPDTLPSDTLPPDTLPVDTLARRALGAAVGGRGR